MTGTTHVVRGRDVLDVVLGHAGDLHQDIVLDTGNARGVEDDSEESNAAESTSLEAAVMPQVCVVSRMSLRLMGRDKCPLQLSSLLQGPAGEIGLVVVPGDAQLVSIGRSFTHGDPIVVVRPSSSSRHDAAPPLCLQIVRSCRCRSCRAQG